MRIAISGMFWPEPYVGSGQYLHNLVAQFAAEGTRHSVVLVIPRYRCSEAPALPGLQAVLMPTPFDKRNRNLAKVWFEQVALPQATQQLRADLLHVPYFGSPLRSRIPVVVTVHDLIPLLLAPYRGSRAVRAYMRLAAAGARRAGMIIADSEHTRQDITRHLQVAPERVAVTHLAASDAMRPQPSETVRAAKDRFGLADPYIFYMGGFDARKNVATAIRAFARARQSFDRRVVLAIGGRLPSENSLLFPDIHRVLLEEHVAEDVVLLGPVSDGEKAALLSGCEAFMFPSQYEGFGLGPLEAMQCAAPVLASSATSVGEVVAGGGVLLSPNDIEAWAQALTRVILDRTWRDELRERGRRRAALFSWQQTARQTTEVYERLLPAGRGSGGVHPER